MADTIREQIIQAIATKMAAITTAGGYNTNMGSHVSRAALYIPAADLPALSIIPKVEEASKVYGLQKHVMPVEIIGFDDQGTANPSVIAELMLGDIIKAFFAGTRSTLVEDLEYKGGGTEEYPQHPDTVTTVSALFHVTYFTIIGNPYSQS